MDKIKIQVVNFIFFLGFFCQGCTSDYSVDLGHGYVFCNEGEDFKFIYHKHSVGGEIPPTVIGYKSNNNFIIVKQKPYKVQKEDTISYFIISKEMEEIYGPYTFNQYVKEKIKHKIDLTF